MKWSYIDVKWKYVVKVHVFVLIYLKWYVIFTSFAISAAVDYVIIAIIFTAVALTTITAVIHIKIISVACFVWAIIAVWPEAFPALLQLLSVAIKYWQVVVLKVVVAECDRQLNSSIVVFSMTVATTYKIFIPALVAHYLYEMASNLTYPSKQHF